MIYVLRKQGFEQQLATTRSLTTDAFSNACEVVSNDGMKYWPLIRASKGFRLKAPKILEKHVKNASDEAIEWAKGQQILDGTKKLANLPTHAPGARPIWHLGALVILKDIKKLKTYRDSFETGNRLGFVNYVTKDHIDRALSAAEEKSA